MNIEYAAVRSNLGKSNVDILNPVVRVDVIRMIPG